MHIDEAWQSGVFREIDRFRARWNRRSIGGHFANAVTLHDHDGIGPKFSFRVPELPESHNLYRLHGRFVMRKNSSYARRTE
jgi:hypothetical protein